MPVVSENQLDAWVRGNPLDAQRVLIDLVARLVSASCPKPTERRFPLGDAANQTGADGLLVTDVGYLPFVPEGRSHWEFGVSQGVEAKAQDDYVKRTDGLPEDLRAATTFVFVTPFSGGKTGGWPEAKQTEWLAEKRAEGMWRGVEVIDGTKLVDWMEELPAVALWLATTIGLATGDVETTGQRWTILQGIGEPPPLTPELFIANRSEAVEKFGLAIDAQILELRLDTHFPQHTADFVAACVQALDDERRVEALGKCLIVTSAEAWKALCALLEPHILVACFGLADEDLDGVMLIETAKRKRHTVVYPGSPGGAPHPGRVDLPEPKPDQVEEALVVAGYTPERARAVATRSAGSLGSLLRLLRTGALYPEWSSNEAAAELVIAAFLGLWDEHAAGDRAAAEALSGKAFGEWIETMHGVAHRPGTPLAFKDGKWKFLARWEGWHALGDHVHDARLEAFREVATTVLSERDPALELEPENRFTAAIHNKVPVHSSRLKRGVAESLALLGAYPEPLIASSSGKAKVVADGVVRTLLCADDWQLWATLDQVHPLLAEASPDVFLECVEQALTRSPSPFDELFGQETPGIGGWNYMSGLLWALETLAWEPSLLSRAMLLLAELESRDPGGNWANRPNASMRDILLPWHPQTVASIEQRSAVVRAVCEEQEDVGWKLVTELLPSRHSATTGTRKPAWREWIPDDWSAITTVNDYVRQVEGYFAIALDLATSHVDRLAQLVDSLDDLAPELFDQLLDTLRADWVLGSSEDERYTLWSELSDFVSRHRKFAESEWALPSDVVDRIAEVADALRPRTLRVIHRLLFGERDLDLYEEVGDYERQAKRLDERRQSAVAEIIDAEGLQGVVEFATEVDSPFRVGLALGSKYEDFDSSLFPLEPVTETEGMSVFLQGFVRGRIRSSGWEWTDALAAGDWSVEQIVGFLVLLPFERHAWELATRLLGDDNDDSYWQAARVNPYEPSEGHDEAAKRLMLVGRPVEAVRCLAVMQHGEAAPSGSLIAQALRSAVGDFDGRNQMDMHDVQELIGLLQTATDVSAEDVRGIEWAYLTLLDEPWGRVRPEFLESEMAANPGAFCQLVRLVYRPRTDEEVEESTDEQRAVARNAYRLLETWRRVPGTTPEGDFDPDAFLAWFQAMRAEAEDSGHLEVALSRFGHVLIHAPADSGGLWIHQSVAQVLNAREADAVRSGFTLAVYNARGVHSYTKGRAELELAEKYGAQADAADLAGLTRLAASIRSLADSYRRDSEREASRDPFED